MNKVSVIIINYNTFTLTSNCIRSVIDHTRSIDYEIILVDNASTEIDPLKFLEQFPQVKLLKSDKNGGFAYGNNLGIEHATGEYILLLNSDTVLQEDTISKSVEYISHQPDAGVVGARMVFPGGRVQNTARRFRSISWELLDLFRFIPLIMSYEKRSQLMLGKYFRHNKNIECDWINGAFFLFPKRVLNGLPGQKLDDRFFMYGEDQLWCEQIGKLGYKILFYNDSTLIHINSGSTSVSKQVALRNKMMKNELVIMKLRKGRSLYYFVFKIIFTIKEYTRNAIKKLFYQISGKLSR